MSPSAGAPTDNYDVQLVDAYGYDLLEGVGMNRDAAKVEHAAIIYSSTSLNPVVDEADDLTLTVIGTFVASAKITIDLYYALGY